MLVFFGIVLGVLFTLAVAQRLRMKRRHRLLCLTPMEIHALYKQDPKFFALPAHGQNPEAICARNCKVGFAHAWRSKWRRKP
jgi:hypothetical protein